MLFLFETPRYRILHTGDFRASPKQITHPFLHNRRVDVLYLDTTYLNPKYAFPEQSDVVNACAEICVELSNSPSEIERRLSCSGANGTVGIKNLFSAAKGISDKSSQTRMLVVVGSYTIGKEKMAIAIAKALKTKIFTSLRKRKTYACLEDPVLNSLLTTDPCEGSVHLVSLQEIGPDVSVLCHILLFVSNMIIIDFKRIPYAV